MTFTFVLFPFCLGLVTCFQFMKSAGWICLGILVETCKSWFDFSRYLRYVCSPEALQEKINFLLINIFTYFGMVIFLFTESSKIHMQGPGLFPSICGQNIRIHNLLSLH
ncbi:hypothetical protein DsansV1_C09g0092511 [Dioscorea sansibarensis]